MDTLTQRTVARFVTAVESLEKALALPPLPEHAERDAALLRFELVAELMPKTLQRILSEQGLSPVLPKDAVRAARAADMVDEQHATMLLGVIDDRNRMVHDYSETFAEELFQRIKGEYAPTFKVLITNVQK